MSSPWTAVGFAVVLVLTLIATASRATVGSRSRAAGTTPKRLAPGSTVDPTPSADAVVRTTQEASRPDTWSEDAMVPRVAPVMELPRIGSASAAPGTLPSAGPLRPLLTSPRLVTAIPPALGWSAGGRSSIGVVAWSALAAIPGVTLGLQDITDATSGRGGLRAYRGVRTHTSVTLTLDMDAMLGWPGLTVFAQHKMKRGVNGSGALGLVQNASNIDADDFTAAGEIWAEQLFANDQLRLKVGRIDFNSEYAATDNGGAFLNASMGYSPSIAAAPTFPLPATAVHLAYTPREGSVVSGGVFDGTGGAPAASGASSRFVIGQVSQSWAIGSDARAGRIGVGAWKHTGLFSAVDATADEDPAVRGASGWYATLDQTLWQRGGADDTDRPTIAAFAQVGRGDTRVAAVESHRGGGLTAVGLVPFRASDLIGVGVTQASWRGGRETISEAFYQLPLGSHLSFVADLQRLDHHASADVHRVGLLSSLRTIITF